MTAMMPSANQITKPGAKLSAGMKLLRTVAIYSAITVAVSAGGVVVGAIIVAPAVSRAKPLFTAIAQGTETNGSIGQADGDGATAASVANVSATEQFKPIAESIAAAKQLEAAQALKTAQRPFLKTVSREAAFFYEDAMDFLGQVPKLTWVFVDVALVLMLSGVWFYRRRNADTAGLALKNSANLARNSATSLPTKLVSGKGSRTPKAVAALAEAGTAPADIARRTGLPHDAVAMLLSLGTLNARQLQPPTA